MKLATSIFKAYDIRAIYGKEIDKSGWAQVIKGSYAYLSKTLKKKNLTVNVSRDMREESRQLYRVTVSTLADLGARVNALDLASTPHSYFALLHLKSDVSMQITASHNPSGYSGMKCVYRYGNKVMKVSGMALRDSVLKYRGSYVQRKGLIRTMQAPLDQEISFALSLVPPISKKFRVVVDTANGMGVTYLKALQRVLPLDIIFMNEELDGTFPNHLSDTLQHQYWTKLCKQVVQRHADFGIATDGDGDRVAFVDEKGRFLPSTLFACLVMDVMHEQEKADKFLIDVRLIMNVVNYAKMIKVHAGITKVGHANITKTLQDTHSDFGGESSGHYFFASNGGAENVIRVIVSVLYKLQSTGKSMSSTLRQYSTAYESTETNFTVPKSLKLEALFRAVAKTHPKAQIGYLDGVSVNYPDYRFNVRGSNTEPVLRLNLEAKSRSLCTQAMQKIRKDLLKIGVLPLVYHSIRS